VSDPKSQATAPDLQKQFELLLAIRDKVSAVHSAVNDIQSIRTRLSGTSPAIVELRDALDAVSTELAERRFSGFDDQMLVFDLKLNNRMAALQNCVAQGDFAPTDQQQAVFKELSAEIDATLSKYRALKARAGSVK
jgi:hypothetical protein